VEIALRGACIDFKDNPFLADAESCLSYESDAVIWVRDGKVHRIGAANDILPQLPAGTPVTHYRDSVIMPGFIDSHVHYPQTPIIGAYGEQLLEWLNNYTFVAEQAFADKEVAREVARFYLRENLRNGVTSATVYCTVFPQSVDALFEEAQPYGMRLMAGKIMMDRNAPAALTDTAQSGYDQSKQLIERWHKQDRFEYVITPRFAPTSTPEQLEAAGALAREYPDTLIQSHISENKNEIAWVNALYPQHKGYADVYRHFGLLRERAIYGHGIHLSEEELHLFSETGAAIAHCPTSNLFLGSGLFNLRTALDPKRPVRVGLATDLGAGTSFSMLQTLNEAYKVAQLNGVPLSATHAFYQATRGTAEALGLQDKIGRIAPGMEADFAVLDLQSTPLIRFRMKYAKDIQEALFIQMTLGDDRAIRATYVNGACVYDREQDAQKQEARA